MQNKIIFTVLMSILSIGAFSQDRNVLFIHGLNGNANSWQEQFVWSQDRYRIDSHGRTYPTDEGVQNYANRIRNGSLNAAGNNTIAIGHSLGGVAIREMDRDWSTHFGGAITFGSPLDGALVANRVIAGTPVENFINNSLEVLRRGPIESAARSRWNRFQDAISAVFNGGAGIFSYLIRGVASRPILDITDDMVGGFDQTILDQYDPNSPTIRDLAENSNYMNGVRSFNSSKPKIFAWGDENSPSHIRLFVSSFTLNDTFVDAVITAYNQVGISYQAAADGISTGWTPWCWNSCRDRKRREKEAWNAGADYIERGWEIAWNNLTGARYRETYTATERIYVCDGSGPNPLTLEPQRTIQPIEEPCLSSFDSDCSNCYWTTRTVTRTRWVNGPGDGLIKRSSQIAEESSYSGISRRLENVNHLEMPSHPSTRDLLNDTYRGLNGGFFRTGAR